MMLKLDKTWQKSISNELLLISLVRIFKLFPSHISNQPNLGVHLNVESTTNIQFFYILQQKINKNLHLQQIL